MAYSVSSTDANCYPGTTVLVNKLGITQGTEMCVDLLHTSPPPGLEILY